MNNASPGDETLVRRLPLPLAQLYRRAHHAKTPLARLQTAYSLWEAALKLLGSVALIEYAQRGNPDVQLKERLQCLASPAVDHWWDVTRRLLPVLADAGDAHFAAIQKLIF